MAHLGNRLFKNTSHAFTVLASILAMLAISTFTGTSANNLFSLYPTIHLLDFSESVCSLLDFLFPLTCVTFTQNSDSVATRKYQLSKYRELLGVDSWKATELLQATCGRKWLGAHALHAVHIGFGSTDFRHVRRQ